MRREAECPCPEEFARGVRREDSSSSWRHRTQRQQPYIIYFFYGWWWGTSRLTPHAARRVFPLLFFLFFLFFLFPFFFACYNATNGACSCLWRALVIFFFFFFAWPWCASPFLQRERILQEPARHGVSNGGWCQRRSRKLAYAK